MTSLSLSLVEFTIEVKLFWDNMHQTHTSLLWWSGCYGNQSVTSKRPSANFLWKDFKPSFHMIVDDHYDRCDRYNCWSLISIWWLGFVQIAGHIPSLCYAFHMIAGIVMIVTIAALVVSINFLRSLTIVHNRYNCRDRLWFYPSDRWQSLRSLAIAGKMKIWFPYDRYDRWTVY